MVRTRNSSRVAVVYPGLSVERTNNHIPVCVAHSEGHLSRHLLAAILLLLVCFKYNLLHCELTVELAFFLCVGI